MSKVLVLGQILGTFCPILDSCKKAIFGWLVSLASYMGMDQYLLIPFLGG
jgi:hypothetical protein